MHDIKEIVQKIDDYKANLGQRNFDVSILDQVVEVHQQWKSLTTLVENNRAEIKKISQQVGQLKKEGKNADELMNQVAQLKQQVESSENKLNNLEEEQRKILLIIPNLISSHTPRGKSEADNVVRKTFGTPKNFSFPPIDHVTLGEKLGVLDFEAATKITGSRFALYKGPLARLERALINFMLDSHREHGYLEILPPMIIHERSLIGAGQLPKFKEDLFKLENMDWYLAPTAEVPLVNIKRDELFPMQEFPIKYCAYTPCFRSEAGSYGKDTRGLIRLHQFNKVELVAIVASDQSEKVHEEMIERASAILLALELPFRQLELCSGDIGFGSQRTIDLEVWLPAQNTYREISSVSNCGDFQARRANIRYRNAQGKPEFAHTLNGSGLAVGRTVVAILENYQNEDGAITIPKVLRPYMNNESVISKIN